MPTRKANGRVGQRSALPARLLNEGDTVEFAISLSHNYQSVKSGATTTIRKGETAQEAQDRLEMFVTAIAMKTLEEVSVTD